MSNYRLEMHRICKNFPGVQALVDVTLCVRAGEIHALLGENGAGKSTLVKILSGAYQRDGGRILLDGLELHENTPSRALALGIVTIYQDSNLALELTVAENIYMGRLPRRQGLWVDWKTLYDKSAALLRELDVVFSPHTKARDLSPAQRQMVEIAKALSMDARVIVLDEPTAALTEHEVEALFAVMRQLKARGVAIILITHRLPEVFAICDRLTVFRDGQWVATDDVSSTDENRLVAQMVGRQVTQLYPTRSTPAGAVVLSVRGLTSERFHDISFDLHTGEIVGLFGLVGAGRTELARAIFGAQPAHTGTIQLCGRPITIRRPQDAIRAGIALVPEDRKTQGLVLPMSVRANVSLPNLKSLSRLGFIRFGHEWALAESYKDSLGIRTPSVNTAALALSGGNQQKIVMSKWLAKTPRVLILDEPTRGIDIGAKSEVHRLVHDLTQQGMAVLLISSELPEIMGMSDRILIMHEGRLAGEVIRAEASEERIMAYTLGQGGL